MPALARIDPTSGPLERSVFKLRDMRGHHLELLLQQALRLLVHAPTCLHVDEFLGVGVVSVAVQLAEKGGTARVVLEERCRNDAGQRALLDSVAAAGFPGVVT